MLVGVREDSSDGWAANTTDGWRVKPDRSTNEQRAHSDCERYRSWGEKAAVDAAEPEASGDRDSGETAEAEDCERTLRWQPSHTRCYRETEGEKRASERC